MAKMIRAGRLGLVMACVLSAVIGYAMVRLWPFGADGGGRPAGAASTAVPLPRKTAPGPKEWTFNASVHWVAHSGGLTVRGDRTFEIDARTYRDCAEDSRPPCDDLRGGKMGIVVHGVITQVSGVRATGRITRTTAPTRYPLGPITFTLDPPHDAVSAQPRHVQGVANFCGPTAPPMWCGA
ncbi:hypothetical protein [Streptomyces sp. NPDC021212]|uniref:hypothetical protein n=1 Tax=Streptomyces sp. NPDC021212 TaxID=3365118 RepID=UPI0037A1732E